jgi:hypothetical protein
MNSCCLNDNSLSSRLEERAGEKRLLRHLFGSFHELGCLIAAALGLLLSTSAVAAAPGDISVTVVDMNQQPVSGSRGGRVGLLGKDQKGVIEFNVRSADDSGRVSFASNEIAAAKSGAFGFVIHTYASDIGLRSQLYDPFGNEWTYVKYDPTRAYDFTIATPSSGATVPLVTWQGTESRLEFSLDLGKRAAGDFWVNRVILQKKAALPDQASAEFGINPIVNSTWFQDRGYTVADNGLASGSTGNIRIQGPAYDQTFLATKTVSNSATSPRYAVHLVNCLWGTNLPARYDPEKRLCTVLFDPQNIFTDRTAPAWDGLAMKSGVDYFALLQVETWIWNTAGASNGLAIGWGPPAAESLLHPLRIPVSTLSLLVLGKTERQLIMQITGDSTRSFTIQSCTNLAAPVAWLNRLTTNNPAGSFTWADAAPSGAARFYRVRQP